MSFEGISVGLVGPVPPPAGGMANQTRQLAELLGAAGAQVLRVATNAPYRPQWVGRWRGLRALVRLVLYVGALWRVCGRCQLLHVMANSGWSWHLCALPALLVGRLRHVPVVINYRGGAAAEFLAKSGVSVRAAMRLASHLVVPSGFLVDVFARHGMHAAVVPNIIDVACFTRRGPRAAGSAHLVVARHLEALYDNATAIRALVLLRQRLPCARLTLAGVGPQAAALHALAVELGVVDAVHFAGHLDRQDMAALYRQADLSLNPSLADNMPN